MIKGALFSVELISAESGCLRAKGSWERVPGSQGFLGEEHLASTPLASTPP